MPRAKSRSARRKGWRTAANSDRHELYELSVQGCESDCALFDRVYKQWTGRLPHSLREDFCGTALLCREWVQWRKGNSGVGVDLDPAVLARARTALAALPARERARVTLLQGDVNRTATEPVDLLVALNFSYFVLHTRKQLRDYFAKALTHVRPGGMAFFDAYGGSGSWSVGEEERSLDGFVYVWHQAQVNPINHHVVNHIHFRFPDGSEMRRAFTYRWRLWTIPEIVEVLEEVGFVRPTVLWEGTERSTGEGNGVFKPTTRGEACEGWIVYVAAQRPRTAARSAPKLGRDRRAS
ncbi:MAG: class I SAM-dependent methyltransferase [Planctomycetota bacterium]